MKQCNSNIKFSLHDAFLEYSSSGMLHNQKIGKPNKIKSVGAIDRKTKNIRLTEQFQNQISKSERGNIDTSNTKIHDCLLSWLGTGTSV